MRFRIGARNSPATGVASEGLDLAVAAAALRVATDASDARTRAATYGALLAVVDAAAAVSGWLAAPALAGVPYGTWRGLPVVLRRFALIALAPLALLPLLPPRAAPKGRPPAGPLELAR